MTAVTRQTHCGQPVHVDVDAQQRLIIHALDRCLIAVIRARRTAAKLQADHRRAAHQPARDIRAENAAMITYRDAFGDDDGAAVGAAIIRISTTVPDEIPDGSGTTAPGMPGRTLIDTPGTTPCQPPDDTPC